MEITKDMIIFDVVTCFKSTKQVFIKNGFKKITDPLKLNTIAKVVNIEAVCKMKDVDLEVFLGELNEACLKDE